MSDEELEQMRRYLADHPVGKRLIAEVERLRSIVRMFHDPGGCRYPKAECTVCEALEAAA